MLSRLMTTLVLPPFSGTTQVTHYQNVYILDFIGAKDDGGGSDNWRYKTCKAPVKMSPPKKPTPVGCWRRSIVVRTLVSVGEISLSCARLLA